MGLLPRFALRRPFLTTLAVLAPPILAAPGLLRLELRTDGSSLVPESPAALTARRLRSEFGFRDPVVLLLRSRYAQGIFCPEALRAVAELTDRAQELPGVPGEVRSLATERGDRFRPGSLKFRRLLEPMPESPEAIAELRSDLAALEIYDGTLVSEDGTAAAVILAVPDSADRVAFLERLADLAATGGGDSLSVDVLGAPVAEALLGTHVLADLRRLIPITLALMALVFAFFFRNAWAVALPLLEIGACLAFVLGGAGWFGVPVYLTTAVLPVILSTIAIADEIHLFTRFAQRRRAEPAAPVPAVAVAVVGEMESPLVRTSLTTAIGFLSFALSPLAPVQAFGVLASVGILYCLVFSLTVVPLAVVRFGTASIHAPFGGERADVSSAGWRMLAVSPRRRNATLVLAALALAAGAGGVTRLRVQDSWVGGFAPGSAFRRATEFFDDHFLGSHLLRFVLRTEPVRESGEVLGRDVEDHRVRLASTELGDPERLAGCRFTVGRAQPPAGGSGIRRRETTLRTWTAAIDSVRREGDEAIVALPRTRGSPRLLLGPADEERLDWTIESRRFAEPRVLSAVEDFEEFLRGQSARSVGGVLGPATYVKTTNFILMDRWDGARAVPDTPYQIDRLWSNYARIRGAAMLGQLLSGDRSAGVVTAYLRHANFADTAALLDTVRAYEREHLAPIGIRVELGGDIAVSQTLIAAIVRTQVRSLLLSLAGILIVATWMNRSLRWGVLSVLPCALAVFLVFAGMGWTGMPLGVATSMFAGMCLGVGVDFAIHFIDRFRREWSRRGASADAALWAAGHVAGPAILVDALVLAVGFGAMMLSAVPLNARLGVITMICVGTALAATLLLLPALLPRGRARA